jgi:outer membrane protein assembly factor BamB
VIARAAGPSSLADPILSASRGGRGLCIHIGAGGAADPELVALLASGSKMLVHGLALDEASMDRARKAITRKGVAGQASVEKASLAPLPYMSNLANLVVIDDWASVSARGLTQPEAMRILAPGGALLVLEGSQWSKTVKPRPAEMDDWRQPMYDVGLTRTSKDKTFSFPIGLRWTDGVPNNIRAFTDCCGVIVVNSTIFTLNSAEIENVPKARAEGGVPIYLVARDAFNGLPLWKLNLEIAKTGVEISAANVPALAGDEDSVYTAYQQNKVIRVDGASGKILWEQPTRHRTARLILLDGVVVAGSWSTRHSVWGYEYPDAGTGFTEAFDAKTGKPLWQKDCTVQQMTAGDGLVHLELAVAATTQPTNWTAKPVNKQTPAVIGVDIRTGQEKWRVEQKEGAEPRLQLISAGPKYVVVTHWQDEKNHYSRVLDAGTGKTIIDGKERKLTSGRTPMIDGLVWFAGRKFDLATGQEKGNTGVYLDSGCTPSGLVWPYVIAGRGGDHLDLSKTAGGGRAVTLHYYGARAACLEGMVIANGMLYTAQNNCQCMPPHLYGFLGLAPCGSEPTAEDFARARAVEKGPAFGMELQAGVANDGTAWPMLRADAARSASSKSKLPATLKETWSLRITPDTKGPLSDSWDSQLTGCLSAPVVAGGKVFVSATDIGQVIACDASGGRRLWAVDLGSRVDGPPTWYRGLCIIGCHDGTPDWHAGPATCEERRSRAQQPMPLGDYRGLWGRMRPYYISFCYFSP